MKVLLFTLLLICVGGCATRRDSHGTRSPAGWSDHCPVRKDPQIATMADMYDAMKPGTKWFSGYISFLDIAGTDNIKTYEYDRIYRDPTPTGSPLREPDPFNYLGTFKLTALSKSLDCLRQIRLTEPVPGGDSNVWQGYVYIERCDPDNDPPFKPKENVLDYSGPGEKRLRQVLKGFWYDKNADGKCVMRTRLINPIDREEGRVNGVNEEYNFTREN